KIIFQRTENMDKQITGLGLGLSLAKKIIEYFDGIIWVEDRVKNNYKEGSNFIILIPAVEN
ncbi:MAG: ATP-binding protein, partial [Candidatus Hermodarchaeota archaeon]